MTGPPDGGDGSDVEGLDEDDGPQQGFPAETAGEYDVFVDGDLSSDNDGDFVPKAQKKKNHLSRWKNKEHE